MLCLKTPVFLLLISCVSCQPPQGVLPFMPRPPAPGPCPVVPVVQNFNLHRYLGRWYEIERFFAPFQTGDCVTADYGLLPNGSVSVINTEVVEGELNSVTGFATLGPNPSEGRLVVAFPFSSGGSFSADGEPNYTVVATDYDNYALVYSCSSFGAGNKFELSWILSRTPGLPQQFVYELKKWATLVNIDAARYSPLKQDNTCLRRQI
ncbi:apolipoprotein D-like [Portunus trituberculatus]|uniref:apolipoprotein D-like n=1 Tax=Portunus trituberculatus TaxID=210409 RepID=UPI001E1CC66D|nr:apolipoprotein D-like [Portunus trituberculatus]